MIPESSDDSYVKAEALAVQLQMLTYTVKALRVWYCLLWGYPEHSNRTWITLYSPENNQLGLLA